MTIGKNFWKFCAIWFFVFFLIVSSVSLCYCLGFFDEKETPLKDKIKGDLSFYNYFNVSKEVKICMNLRYDWGSGTYEVQNYKVLGYGTNNLTTWFDNDCVGYNTEVHSHPDNCKFSKSDIQYYDNSLKKGIYIYELLICKNNQIKIGSVENYVGELYEI